MRLSKKLAFDVFGHRLCTLLALCLLALCSVECSWAKDGDDDKGPAEVKPQPEKKETATSRPVILLTGFEPFGDSRPPNPSWEGVARLNDQEWKGYRLVSKQMRCVWSAPRQQLQQWISEYHPVAVFSFGQGGPDSFTLESRASNRRGNFPDNENAAPRAPLIVDNGPDEVRASVNVQGLWQLLSEKGYKIRVSTQAGRYLCEECLYSLEYLKKPDKLETVSFCHVPPLGTHVGDKLITAEYVAQFVRDVLDAWYDVYHKPKDKDQTSNPIGDRDQLLAPMVPIIARSIARKDTDHPVFHGCLDWHSAVHGHWALLRIARLTGRHQDTAREVEKSLDTAGIARESKFLQEHEGFELPYGRAWFLRLAIEFELWAGESRTSDPQRLRAMADDVAKSLLTFYNSQPPDPRSHEYGNASWALVQLDAYAVHTKNSALREKTQSLIREHMLKPADAPSFQDDGRSPEFFSRFGNWAYLIALTQDRTTLRSFLRDQSLPDEVIQPVALLPGAHHLGMTWSRAWALRALSRLAPDPAARARFEKAYLDHVATGMRQHMTHSGDFMVYDHWVPQFAVYAITE